MKESTCLCYETIDDLENGGHLFKKYLTTEQLEAINTLIEEEIVKEVAGWDFNNTIMYVLV